ncbi:hypothetical protein KI387_022763, partial [Taxus chinensis]
YPPTSVQACVEMRGRLSGVECLRNPSIAWMDLHGIERGMNKLAKRSDDMVNSMIEEHQVVAKKRMVPDFLTLLCLNAKIMMAREKDSLTIISRAFF